MPDVITDEMRRTIGLKSPPVTYNIERGHIRRFAEAIGDPNKHYLADSPVVPPTFFRALNAGPLPINPFHFGNLKPGYDAGSDWEYFHPVTVGDRVTVVSAVDGYETKPGKGATLVFIKIRTTFTNQRGELVATEESKSVLFAREDSSALRSST